MSNIFLISDTHFNHTRTWSDFKKEDGQPMRPFTSNEEMDETMVDNWNRVVSNKDTIYHLGDVVMKRSMLPILSRLNGNKILIKGNHDVFMAHEYLNYFSDLRALWKLDKFILTHVPMHPNSLMRWGTNVHGHLHSGVVTRTIPCITTGVLMELPDPRYINVSVEQINYTPISLEELKLRVQ